MLVYSISSRGGSSWRSSQLPSFHMNHVSSITRCCRHSMYVVGILYVFHVQANVATKDRPIPDTYHANVSYGLAHIGVRPDASTTSGTFLC